MCALCARRCALRERGEAEDAGAHAAERYGTQVVFQRQVQDGLVARLQQAVTAAHRADGVQHMGSREVVAFCYLCLPCLASIVSAAFVE